jgi:hypothetical protein
MSSIRKIAAIGAVLVMLVLAGSSVFASDTQFWTTFTTKDKITDKLSLENQLELRWTNDVKEFSYVHGDLGFGYKIHPLFTLSFGMRFQYETKATTDMDPFKGLDDKYKKVKVWEGSIRPLITGTFNFKFGETKLDVRNRMEIKIGKKQTFDSSDNVVVEHPMEYHLRERVQVTLPFTFSPLAIQPYFNDEIFLKLNRDKDKDENLFWRNRFAFGAKMKMTGQVSLSPYFLLEMTKKKSTDSEWGKNYVIGLNTDFSF